ncbi:MAG: hypothetical protein K2I30_05560 [Clostridia bacterium]|nr:hypothetical protein [Clostridia bacterium]
MAEADEVKYIEKFYRFTCKDCGIKKEYSKPKEAQDFGWAIARGGKACYCPAHALQHRSTGCKGARVKQSATVQLTISEVGNA